MKANRFRSNALSWTLLIAVLAGEHGIAATAATAQSATHDGMPVGFTAEGHPFIGKSDAPVTLEEWSDYLCPFCSRHFRQTVPPLLDQYVRTGQLKLVFRDLPIAGLHPTASQGHVAALCVGEQGAAAYWAMHDALFARQSEWNRLPDPGAFLSGVAAELGADMEAYASCIADGAKAALVEDSLEQGRVLGYNGTPSFRFSSTGNEKTYDLSGAHPLARFARFADPLIAGEDPPEDPKPEPAEMPLWAKPEGLAPDPDRPDFNLAGDAYKGNPAAALVVVEFNDFQCPACNKHALEAQPLIDREFIDTGKVLWVDKHLPLKMHPYAPLAAVAAECAGNQQKYWDMHHLLHEKSESWTNDNADSALRVVARELQLDMPAFLGCFNSRQGLERVLQDLYDAQGLITRAPTFVIIQDGKGSTTGPLPADQFVTLLSKRLEAIDESADKSELASVESRD